MSDKPILSKALSPFVIQWGELGSAWGIGRSAARIHGLLLVSDGPLTADDIASGLGIARSNVSMSMKELRAIGLVETHPSLGDRKERFTAVDDPVEMTSRIAAYRKAREFDPARDALTAAAEADADKAVKARLERLSNFAQSVDRWQGEMSGLSTGRMKAVLKAGAALAEALPGKKKKKKG